MGRDRTREDWAAWMTGRVAAPDPPGLVAPAQAETPAETAAGEGPSPNAGTPAVSAGTDADASLDVDVEGERVPSAAVADDQSPSAAGRPGSMRREATRQRIIDAAREVFAERGVIGGTVEDICERAGFTRGAFYSNFIDKDDVLGALVEREQARLLAHLDASLALVDQELAAASDLGTAVASIVDRILRSMPVDRQFSLVQAELEIHAVRRPDLARPFLETNQRFSSRIAVFLEAAMARNDLELTVDAVDVVEASVAVVERSVRRAWLAGGGADPDAMARAVLPGMLLALSRPVEA